MSRLTNKVAIITGASSGIGRAAARLFAQRGAAVVVAARREPKLNRLVAEIEGEGGAAVACAGDVSDERFAERLVAVAESRFGGLDIAFNNAGTLGAMGELASIDAAACLLALSVISHVLWRWG